MITLTTVEIIDLHDAVTAGTASSEAVDFHRHFEGRIDAIVAAQQFFPGDDWDFDTAGDDGWGCWEDHKDCIT
tara:strand:+ start:17914 stop:18132 length:219 start_codon:yes stop_codon:yes gene_type:complete